MLMEGMWLFQNKQSNARDMKRSLMPIIKFLLNAALFLPAVPAWSQPSETSIQIDGGKRYQTMDGFGVNINAAWWLDGEYRNADIVKPAIDMLIDSLGATIFRVVIEEIDWEPVNDDNDPGNFNMSYYNRVFSGPRFRGVWNTLHYLNQRGVTDRLMISLMGGPPAAEPLAKADPVRSWMGNTNYSIDPAKEDEFVETIAALLLYARNTEKISFSLVSPMNETDIVSSTKGPEHPDGIVEGPNIPDAVQYVRIIKKLAGKLDRIGLSDIRLVTPDAAGDKLFNACFDEMIKDPGLMEKLYSWGVHQYGKDASNYLNTVRNRQNTVKTYWVTETAGIKNLLGQLDDSASAYIFWDGFDCVYQHGRRNGYGSKPPNDWVFWEGDQGRPLLAYNQTGETWTPRKQFYEFSQLFKFVVPGAVRIGTASGNPDIAVYAYLNPSGQPVIFGRNNGKDTLTLRGTISNLPAIPRLAMYITNKDASLKKNGDIIVSGNSFIARISAGTLFTLVGPAPDKQSLNSAIKPEPAGWYPGDMHVHRNCGEVTPVWPETSLAEMMDANQLSVISMLADMGNGEVKDNRTDLAKVTGGDAPESTPGKIVHWDAEWHFDPEGVTFEHKALGGHLVMLGLTEASTVWEESPYQVLEWGRKQDAVMGFCHMQYLDDSIQDQLNCCIPVDFPVETALGTIDFLAEDVWLNDASIHAYYKLLNCGFRPGWAAGTDFPCNNSAPLGSLLTYVQVKDGPLTYRKWIEGIKNGRTVVTTNGHNEFLDLKVNGTSCPGDEISMETNGHVNVNVVWTSILDQEGDIEIVCNGKIVAKQHATAGPGKPGTLAFDLPVKESSWICARRMNAKGHQSHTAPVYVNIGNRPVRANPADAEYFVKWIENTLANIEDGAPWRRYFSADIETVRARYRKAAGIFRNIAGEGKLQSAERN
jgi:O-glycosyl hydrolase